MTTFERVLTIEEVGEGRRLCRCMVTTETLTALGFPVEVRDTIVGCTTVVVEGQAFHRARDAAEVAGLVTMACTHGRAEVARKASGKTVFRAAAVVELFRCEAITRAEAERILTAGGFTAELAELATLVA